MSDQPGPDIGIGDSPPPREDPDADAISAPGRTIEFAIPASPTPEFCAQIAFFRMSLDHLGGIYKKARLIAVFGDTETGSLPEAWLPHLDTVEIVWADPAEVAKIGAIAQGELRLQVFSEDADVACLCDADTVLMRPIPEILDAMASEGAVLGTIAHGTPFRGRSSVEAWDEVATRLLDAPIPLDHRHTLVDPDNAAQSPRARCPFYVNQGVLFGPPALFKALLPRVRELRQALLEHYGEPFFAGQVAFALTVHDTGAPHRELPLRYNFPNDPLAERLHADELKDIAFLHYLRLNEFDRSRIFTTETEFNRFLRLPLTGSNLLFQRHVLEVTGGSYPWRGPAA
ncbi:hypothetical protein [Breoghania sp. L-A4]|uniref:hypothetical protein n=1 Tax=Breoghania sp. L-A4 TaxID=2304600 RepID=UPI000E35CD61|nr:hypothetical protein [Breoghania sp. L-A4]AXS41419.1 hypothetical protein D1F64_17135 [Breoghania sp. L-A4]